MTEESISDKEAPEDITEQALDESEESVYDPNGDAKEDITQKFKDVFKSDEDTDENNN